MRSPFKGLSSFQKFFITLSVIFIIAIIDYQSFLDKSRKVEIYDELHSRISAARVSTTKLEYLLDMFVVARRFEGDTIEIIKGDVAVLNENITELAENPAYRSVWKSDAILSEGIQSIADDWMTIKAEIKRLNDAMSQDEVMLIHNAVDMNTVIVTEKAERLLNAIADRRKTVFTESKALALRSIIGFVLLMLVMSLVYYKKVISPVSKASLIARRILAGDRGARFQEGTGAMGVFGAELNRMTESMDKSVQMKAAECTELHGALAEKSFQIGAVTALLAFAGKTLAQGEVFGFALGQTVAAISADAGAVYIRDNGVLRLKSSTGFDERFLMDAGSLDSFPERTDQGSVIFDTIAKAGYPLGGALIAAGAAAAVSVPLISNSKASGLLLVVYRDQSKFRHEHLRFLEAVASSIALSSGHSSLVQQEHSSRKFLERLLTQLPVGLAVFDKEGRCSLMSSQARRMLGAAPDMDATAYNVFEDSMLKSQGILTSVRKSYEGYSTEFIINYNPMSSRAIGIAMAPVKLRMKSFPLYDAGGEVSNMVLMFEDLAEGSEAQGGKA